MRGPGLICLYTPRSCGPSTTSGYLSQIPSLLGEETSIGRPRRHHHGEDEPKCSLRGRSYPFRNTCINAASHLRFLSLIRRNAVYCLILSFATDTKVVKAAFSEPISWDSVSSRVCITHKQLDRYLFTDTSSSDTKLARVPGTVLLNDENSQADDAALNLKHGTGRNAHIVLSPQPSADPNDPLNWPQWKKELIIGILSLGAMLNAGTNVLLALS